MATHIVYPDRQRTLKINSMKKRQVKPTLILAVTLFVLIQITLCLSCTKEEDIEANDLIIGQWEWIETSNPWTGIKYTPDTEGYTQSTIYKEDNTVESYKNGELVGIESYLTREVVYDPQDPNSETAMVLIINESESYFSINNDTLIVGQAHVDGPTSIFKRIE
jgi:hypothetical protein